MPTEDLKIGSDLLKAGQGCGCTLCKQPIPYTSPHPAPTLAQGAYAQARQDYAKQLGMPAMAGRRSAESYSEMSARDEAA